MGAVLIYTPVTDYEPHEHGLVCCSWIGMLINMEELLRRNKMPTTELDMIFEKQML